MESTVFVAVFVSASTEFKQWLDNVIWFSFRSCEEQGVGLSDPSNLRVPSNLRYSMIL